MGIRREEQQQGWRGMGKRAGGRGGAGKMGMIGKGELAGNGLRGVWVVGEGFLRGVGSVFDVSSTPVYSNIAPPCPFPKFSRSLVVNPCAYA